MSNAETRSVDGAPSFEELLDAIRVQNEKCLEEGIPEVEPCATNQDAMLACAPPAAQSDPEARLAFRRPLPLLTFQGTEDDAPAPKLSRCVPVALEDIQIRLALDLLFEQSWYFQDLAIDSLAATIELSPAEVLRLSVRTSQRKVLTRSSVDEVEQTESTEATITDRDVINVTRSSSHTDNWEVSGNASFSIPVNGGNVDFGASGGMSGSATRTAGATSEQITESTRKSARNLRALRKIEVTETSETFEERERSRRVTNPYRDRSLLLKVFGVGKEFCVEVALGATQPVLLLDIKNINFDRGFVVGNAAFLDAYLIDRRLALELPDALEAVVDQTPVSTSEELDDLARIALDYLFNVDNIFNVPEIGPDDANNPDSSYNATLSNSGLSDAVANNLGIVFTTLNYFFKVYKNEVDGNRRLATPIALAIEDQLHARWFGIEENDSLSNVLDTEQFTEAFRRVGGFLRSSPARSGPLSDRPRRRRLASKPPGGPSL
jgi:hypothetical protein